MSMCIYVDVWMCIYIDVLICRGVVFVVESNLLTVQFQSKSPILRQ